MSGGNAIIGLFPNLKPTQKILVENDLNFCYNQLKYGLGSKYNNPK